MASTAAPLPEGSDWTAPPPNIKQQRKAIVDRLMASTAAPLPESPDWIAPPHKQRETLDHWIEELHEAVQVSSLCSWERPMKPREQGIQALGIATLNYGYCFKFRFKDDGHGDLLHHGTAVGNVIQILQEGFMPRHTGTLQKDLKKAYGVVPPLVWFSNIPECASRYPMHMWCGDFALGEPLAHDAPQPVRMIFHVRVNSSERLAHKHTRTNDQHGFSPESVHSIVGLDVIATCFDATSVKKHKLEAKKHSPATVQIADYCDMEFLEKKMAEILPLTVGLTVEVDASEFDASEFDPRSLKKDYTPDKKGLLEDKKGGLHTKSPEELDCLLKLVKRRDALLEDQRELQKFVKEILFDEDRDRRNPDRINELSQSLTGRVKTLLRTAMLEGAGRKTSPEAAQDILSFELESEELAHIPVSGKGLRVFTGSHALKHYRQKLQKAKDDTKECFFYEKPCPDPLTAPKKTEPAVSSIPSRRLKHIIHQDPRAHQLDSQGLGISSNCWLWHHEHDTIKVELQKTFIKLCTDGHDMEELVQLWSDLQDLEKACPAMVSYLELIHSRRTGGSFLPVRKLETMLERLIEVVSSVKDEHQRTQRS